MKKNVAILLLLILITSCKASSGNTTEGNKKIVSIEKSISSYSEISIVGSCNIVYEQQTNKKPYLRIEIDENLAKYVQVQVKNGALSISLDGRNRNVQPTKFKAYTNSESLSKVKIKGSGDVTLKGKVKSQSLEISVGGSGSLYGNDMQCNNLHILVGGSGGVKIGGNASDNNISINGSGSVDAVDLMTRNTSCQINGSGSASVYANEILKSKINGSGNISYKGKPEKHIKTINGSGTILKL